MSSSTTSNVVFACVAITLVTGICLLPYVMIGMSYKCGISEHKEDLPFNCTGLAFVFASLHILPVATLIGTNYMLCGVMGYPTTDRHQQIYIFSWIISSLVLIFGYIALPALQSTASTQYRAFKHFALVATLLQQIFGFTLGIPLFCLKGRKQTRKDPVFVFSVRERETEWTKYHRNLQRVTPNEWEWYFVSSLIKQTWLYNEQIGRDALNLSHKSISMKELYSINNTLLFIRYTSRSMANGKLNKMDIKPQIRTLNVSTLDSEVGKYILQDDEVFLFHGTKFNNIQSIVENGFDLGKSRSGLFGPGIYLAESSQKSDQYCDDINGRRNGDLAMFVVRTRLGKDIQIRGENMRFREFVVKNSSDVYPKYLVIYNRDK